MILTYNFTLGCFTKSTERACDEGFKAMQEMIVKIAKEMKKGLWFTCLIWLLSRFYKKSVYDDYVEYNLFLIK